MKEPEHGSGGGLDPAVSPVQSESVDTDGPVLVAVDFSDDSERALIWALDHARRMKAKVRVLHVVHDPSDAPGTYRSENGDPLEPMQDVAERKLSSFLEEVGSRHPETSGIPNTETVCRPGLPVETILSVARESGASHLVLGCRGRNAASRLLFGSTSQRVAQKARIPVTIVKVNGQ